MTDEEMAAEWVTENTGFNPKEPLGKIAIRIFLAGLKAGSQLDRVWHDYDAGEDCYEDSHEGRWVKREEGGAKWYSLQGSVQILPAVDETVLNEHGDKVVYAGRGMRKAYSEYYEKYVEADPPVAWCEIPKFEEVEGA